MDPDEDGYLPPLETSASTEPEMDPAISAFIQTLNHAQRIAVTTPANVLQILAPAGSGKTRTLTARVAHLLSPPLNLPPNTVIVATFTVKAAREMKERIISLIGEERARGLILGTFHSIARRWLCIYGELIGVPKGFGIADSGDSEAIVKRCLKRIKGGAEGKVDAGQVRSKISNYKARGGLSAEVRMREGNEFAEVFDAYEESLKVQGLLDYDDLLTRCVQLLREYPETGQRIRAVLVDEFQDTNMVQWELVRLFSETSKRVTIVGDPDQSIYGFRAAEIGNLARMKNWFKECQVVCLEENYRSAGAILGAAEEVITQDKQRPEKPLVPTHGFGVRPVLRKLPMAQIEGQWIVGEIKRVVALSAGRITLDDVAVLVRSASLTRTIESALGRAGMAYRMVGGSRFFDRVEVKLVLDYLRVVYNPNSSDSLARIIGTPPRRVGELTIRSMIEEAESKGKTLWVYIKEGLYGGFKSCTTKIMKPAEEGLSKMVGILIGARKFLEEDVVDPATPEPMISDIISYLLRKLEIEQYLKTKYPQDHETRWANISELIAQSLEFQSSWSPEFLEYDEESAADDHLPHIRLTNCLADFLATIALTSERTEDAVEGAQPRVTLSTIHASKGLEWPIIFIPAVYSGSIPHSRSDDTDEERRLLYVAMTRAQALLYLSYPTNNTFGSESKLSPFLSEGGVQKHFCKCGPSLPRREVAQLLHILGRDVPSQKEINQATAALESVEDDTYPLDPDVQEEDKPRKKRIYTDDDDHDDYADLDDIAARPKPRGLPGGFGGFGGFTTPTTIMTSMTTTTMAAFQTASVHMATYHGRAEADLTKRPKFTHPKTSRFGDTILEPKDSKPVKAPTKVDKAQPPVTAFFAKPTQPVPPAPPAPKKEEEKKDVATTKTPVKPGMKTPERPKFVMLSSSPAVPPPTLPVDENGGGAGVAKKRRLGVGGKFVGWGEKRKL
ncbi:P-loop containing nucleoside triphosphate hydrolase protein [Ascobolus immersus RN42]|uniref:DNA 3'-5' helicase n=1 Tax=Ascobolus immersus RN42 TaxID=1160509 RepID=A0A3N4IJS4_ASCIM|nr:P-loop containing nucleoside triphosphate hydrolase protein [Ascobolus immersus RN42]